RWLRIEASHGSDRRGGRGAALPHATFAARRDASDHVLVLRDVRLSQAGHNDAAAPGNSRTVASRRVTQRHALRRAESHRDADGRALLARLAVAATGEGGR